MSKRKRKKKASSSSVSRRGRRPSATLQKTLDRAERLIDAGRALEALSLLEPLLVSYPRVVDLHTYVGYARIEVGDLWGALAAYERAQALSGDPALWLQLAPLCLYLGLNGHALHAFRQVLKQEADYPGFEIEKVRETIATLEEGVAELSRSLDVPAAQVERGLCHLDDGQRAMRQNDFPSCIAANRRAIRLLGSWPPPHNNLSLALFYDGQPEKAIASARRVLSLAPDNLQALSNAIRFLAWTGQMADARALWPQLKDATPHDRAARSKMTEAAAILDEDQAVYQLLRLMDERGVVPGEDPGLSQRMQLFLAVAEANLGKRAARRRLRALKDDVPWAGDLLEALDAGRPGPGWAERFPYFHISELMPVRAMDEFIELIGLQETVSLEEFRDRVARFSARFPQIVLMGEKMIWEEMQPAVGVGILEAVGTPAAYAVLRRFGLSQVGEDDERIQALLALSKAGEIAPDEVVLVWSRGEWREVQLRMHEISYEHELGYAEEVVELLNEGAFAMQGGDEEQAEDFFQRVVELDPHAKEAYNNLGALYARRGDHERAKEMFQAAVDLDPFYVFPRCNLASYLLDEDDIEAARDMIQPLADVSRFHRQDMAFYSYTQARILIGEEAYEEARKSLEIALGVWPGYEPAEEMLEYLDEVALYYDSYFQQQRKRDRAKRARLQAKLSTSDPTLSDALSVYTKDMLTGMGWVVLPRGGWSTLRKAELLQEIVAGLSDLDNLKRIIAGLDEEEHSALRRVLACGGWMSWQDFDAVYGNDLEESPDWQWYVPETTMGRLRLHGLLVETTVDGELRVAVPLELRQLLVETLV